MLLVLPLKYSLNCSSDIKTGEGVPGEESDLCIHVCPGEYKGPLEAQNKELFKSSPTFLLYLLVLMWQSCKVTGCTGGRELPLAFKMKLGIVKVSVEFIFGIVGKIGTFSHKELGNRIRRTHKKDLISKM